MSGPLTHRARLPQGHPFPKPWKRGTLASLQARAGRLRLALCGQPSAATHRLANPVMRPTLLEASLSNPAGRTHCLGTRPLCDSMTCRATPSAMQHSYQRGQEAQEPTAPVDGAQSPGQRQYSSKSHSESVARRTLPEGMHAQCVCQSSSYQGTRTWDGFQRFA